MVSDDIPLLVDPPIDDESYRREASSLPSDEQKHIIYASYCLTITISRFFEIISILLMAYTYTANLIPLTAYSFLVLFASLFNERLILFIVGSFKSRLNLMNFIILIQRLSMFFFASLLLVRNVYDHWAFKLFVFFALTTCTILLKLNLALFQLTYRNDWFRVLSNSQQAIRVHFERLTHGWSVIIALLFPVLSGCIKNVMSVRECSKLIIFISILGLLVELSLFHKLHNTCFALHLPRSHFAGDVIEHAYLIEAHPMIGVLTTPTISASPMANYSFANRPVSRIIGYIKLKPIPVMVTFGVLLVNVSLITVGPHMVWFLLRSDISPAFIGFIKMLQTLVTLHPTVSARRSVIFTSVGTILAVALLAKDTYFNQAASMKYIRMFAFSVVLARSGIPTINLIGEKFVEGYLADEEVHKLYKENAVWLGTQCEMFIHLLPLIWPRKEQLIWPILVSAILTFVGIGMALRVITKHMPYNPI